MRGISRPLISEMAARQGFVEAFRLAEGEEAGSNLRHFFDRVALRRTFRKDCGRLNRHSLCATYRSLPEARHASSRSLVRPAIPAPQGAEAKRN